jgi:hypothetical protein
LDHSKSLLLRDTDLLGDGGNHVAFGEIGHFRESGCSPSR